MIRDHIAECRNGGCSLRSLSRSNDDFWMGKTNYLQMIVMIEKSKIPEDRLFLHAKLRTALI